MLGLKSTSDEPFVVGGQVFPRVTWYKHGSLIRLKLICGILLLSSATNGFDGSMSKSRVAFSLLWTIVMMMNSERPAGARLLAGSLQPPFSSHLGLAQCYLLRGSGGRPPVCPMACRWHWSEMDHPPGLLLDLSWRYPPDCIHDHWDVVSIAEYNLFRCQIAGGHTNHSCSIAARFIIGLGICYTQSCSPMLITEIAHPQYRGKLTTVRTTVSCISTMLTNLPNIYRSTTPYGTSGLSLRPGQR